jgi:hypothetical protein
LVDELIGARDLSGSIEYEDLRTDRFNLAGIADHFPDEADDVVMALDGPHTKAEAFLDDPSLLRPRNAGFEFFVSAYGDAFGGMLTAIGPELSDGAPPLSLVTTVPEFDVLYTKGLVLGNYFSTHAVDANGVPSL